MSDRPRPSQRRGATGIVDLILAALLITISSCIGIGLLSFDGDAIPGTTGSIGDWYEIYFTDPTCPPEDERQGGLDETIASDIRRAQRQVDVAAYDFDAEPMIDALIELEQRGLIVRVVTDEDNGDLPGIRRLRRNGISVIEDKRAALMHSKFVVIDGRYVWTGSMNFTSNGAYCNNNNLVRFDLPELAANYAAEMDEMYVDGSFGPTSPAETPYPRLLVGSVRLENYFASEEKISPVLVNLINNAAQQVLFMAFSLTSEAIGQAIIDRAEAGVPVRGVFETSGSENEFSFFSRDEPARLVQSPGPARWQPADHAPQSDHR